MSIFDENRLLQQARCPCGVSITSSEHVEGCTYPAEQAKLMQSASEEQLARMNAGAQNAYRPSRFDNQNQPDPDVLNAMARRDERERRAYRRAVLWFALFVVVVAGLAAAATTAPLWWHPHPPVGPCGPLGRVQMFNGSNYLCAGPR